MLEPLKWLLVPAALMHLKVCQPALHGRYVSVSMTHRDLAHEVSCAED